MKPKLVLPKKGSLDKLEPEIECPDNVVIIGANGSGKSKMGAWIELHPPIATIVHRISAQKALMMSLSAPMKSLEESERELLWGNNDPKAMNLLQKTDHRWHQQPTTWLQNDYDKVLSMLFAKSRIMEHQYREMGREKAKAGEKAPLPAVTPIEILCQLWDAIFPHIELKFEDEKVLVIPPIGTEYHGKEMSDGERVVIYFLGQCLCVPQNSIIIIDEPEQHLHKSILDKLWSNIEHFRPDCLFIFITHDVDFAASQKNAKKVWVKQYVEKKGWDWDFIPTIENLPENLVLELLGNRKNVLFIEGDLDSWDYSIFSVLYPECFLVPRGGYEKVIESTKAFRSCPSLHFTNAYGLIDRDYRTSEELDSLAISGVYSLKVAEIEHLFCVKEIIQIICQHLSIDFNEKFSIISQFVIGELRNNLEREISRHVANRIQYKLNTYNKKAIGEAELQRSLVNLTGAINTHSIYEEYARLFQSIVDNSDYEKALLYYNEKSLGSRIGPYLGQALNEYPNLVFRLLQATKNAEIFSAIRKCLPLIPP